MEQIREVLSQVIDCYSKEILEAGQEILTHPELGFKKVHTKEVTEAFFEKHKIPYTSNHALAGVKGRC